MEHYQRHEKALSRDYEKEEKRTKSRRIEVNSQVQPKTASLNLNELDFIIEQLENLPNKRFD